MSNDVVAVIIAALISPLFLKLVEYVLNKNSQNEKETRGKLEALGKRVDELRDLNIKQTVEIGVLRMQLKERDQRINELEKHISRLQTQQDNQ